MTKLPGLGKLVTFANVLPWSVLRHSPWPPRTPRYRIPLRFGSITSRSPMPRPGMLPPSRNGRAVDFQVRPRSVDRRIAAMLGSHSGMV